jgi:4-hydroxy-tetrahydrodipicolinate synthase
VQQTNGRAKVVINSSAPSTKLTIQISQNAAELGADSVMVIPPIGVSEREVRGYYEDIAKTVNLPIFIQDITSAPVTPALAGKLAQDNENICYAKVETLPTPPRVSKAIERGNGKLIVFGGAGGSFLIEELQRGAVGTMPWASIPEAYKEPLDLFFDNKEDEARRQMHRFEPILRILSQPGVGFSLTKEILKVRGVFKTTNVRSPYDAPDSSTIAETHRILEDLQLSKY